MIEVIFMALFMTIPSDNHEEGFFIIYPEIVDHIAECDISSSYYTLIAGCTIRHSDGTISVQLVEKYMFNINPFFCMTEWDHEWHHARGLLGHNHDIFTDCHTNRHSAALYLDGDNDGIHDSKDECPTTKEVYNRFLDHDGCPDWVGP